MLERIVNFTRRVFQLHGRSPLEVEVTDDEFCAADDLLDSDLYIRNRDKWLWKSVDEGGVLAPGVAEYIQRMARIRERLH